MTTNKKVVDIQLQGVKDSRKYFLVFFSLSLHLLLMLFLLIVLIKYQKYFDKCLDLYKLFSEFHLWVIGLYYGAREVGKFSGKYTVNKSPEGEQPSEIDRDKGDNP